MGRTHPCCPSPWWQHLRPPFFAPCCSHYRVCFFRCCTHPQLFPKSRLFLTPSLFCSGESLITQIIHPQEHELIPSLQRAAFSAGLCGAAAAPGPVQLLRSCRDSPVWPGWGNGQGAHSPCSHPLGSIPLGLPLLPRSTSRRDPECHDQHLQAWLRWPQQPSTDPERGGEQGSSHVPQCSTKTTRGAACAACPGRANTILKEGCY